MTDVQFAPLEPSPFLKPIEPVDPIDLIQVIRIPTAGENDSQMSSKLGGASESQSPDDENGCYLTFDTVSEGTLFLNWSKVRMEGAYAFFRPGRVVPKFKYKQNGGKHELIRGLRGGTGKGMKRYFEGWVQFVKLAREFCGELFVFHDRDVMLYYLDASNRISRIQCDVSVPHSVHIDAIAAITAGNSVFEGVSTVTKDYFAGTGNREGAALLM
mmetsp:Transcript_16292/g.26552  ORF Transcript_16292/g.26552 Transcript_16292/m.26552 type:complete len:214 (+) Transcript_16292:1535-2176(+)